MRSPESRSQAATGEHSATGGADGREGPWARLLVHPPRGAPHQDGRAGRLGRHAEPADAGSGTGAAADGRDGEGGARPQTAGWRIDGGAEAGEAGPALLALLAPRSAAGPGRDGTGGRRVAHGAGAGASRGADRGAPRSPSRHCEPRPPGDRQGREPRPRLDQIVRVGGAVGARPRRRPVPREGQEQRPATVEAPWPTTGQPSRRPWAGRIFTRPVPLGRPRSSILADPVARRFPEDGPGLPNHVGNRPPGAFPPLEPWPGAPSPSGLRPGSSPQPRCSGRPA